MTDRGKPSRCVLIPAQNCEHAIDEVIQRINDLGMGLSIIVVDDFSQDDTFGRADAYDNVFVHRNDCVMGYGGTTTKLYEIAAEKKADFVVNVHGDLGHRPEDIVPILEALQESDAGVVVGSRLVYLKDQFREHGLRLLFKPDLRGNMSLVRLVGHFGLTFVQNILFGQRLHSYHEGMRGCTGETVSWILKRDMPHWYDYDATLLVLAASSGIKVAEVPSPPHYSDEANSSAPPIRYGIRVLKNSLKSCRELRRMAANIRSQDH